MRRIARGVLRTAVLSAIASSTGCILADRSVRLDPGLTGYSQVLGWVTQRYVYPLPVVERAVVEAMNDMKMHSVSKKPLGKGHKDDLVVLNGLLFDGRCILVELEPQGEGTVVRTRIDVYGDEPQSQILMQRTSVRLATMPQSVTPPFEPRALSDSVLHRGMNVEGYRGAPLR